MTYSDNPRKIYGKVKIIYSDGEISSEMSVNVSGNAQISNPEQVYMGHLSPSIKTCSMDGNSYMGQGYQMNDEGLVCGWRSEVHSDVNGIFTSPPRLEISFISRTIMQVLSSYSLTSFLKRSRASMTGMILPRRLVIPFTYCGISGTTVMG